MYDLAIAGAGPAGSVLAFLAARTGLRILLTERSCFTTPRYGEVAVPELRPLLARLGLAHLLTDKTHVAVPSVVSIWGSNEAAEHDSIFSPFGDGIHLDRCAFDHAIALAAATAGADLKLATPVRFEKQQGGGYAVVCRDKTVADTRYAVLAGGRTSGSHRIFGERHYLDDQVAIAARLTAAGTCNEAGTIIEAIAGGWFYLAALPKNRMIAVFLTRANGVPKNRMSRHRFWLDALARTQLVRSKLISLPDPNALSVVDARASYVSHSAGKDWCAIGDARFAPDPLSGQGILWAIEDAMWAFEALTSDPFPDLAKTADARTQSQLTQYRADRNQAYSEEQRFPNDAYWRTRA